MSPHAGLRRNQARHGFALTRQVVALVIEANQAESRKVKRALLLCLCTWFGGPLAAAEPLAFASGSWFDPDRNGEGFVVQVLRDRQAIVTWFTYPPAGEEAGQAWMIGTGTADGDRIEIGEMLRPAGAVFGPGFDPSDVVREPWGSLEIVFEDCNHALASWNGPPAFGSGSMELVRLSAIDDVACEPGQTSEPDRVVSGRSGAWFDPGHDGEGWMLEMLADGRMVAYWFTYDDQGRQAWMIGEGLVEGRTLWIEDLLVSGGARFGNDFDPGDVILERWGAFGFLFEECATGLMRYASADPRFGAGTLDPVQLAGLAQTDCTEPGPLEPLVSGTWRSSADTSIAITETASAAADGFVYTAGGYGHAEGLMRFDAAGETHQSLPAMPDDRHHAMATSDGHYIYVAGGYSGRFQDVANDNFWRYDPAASQWEILPDMPNPRAAGAAVHIHGRIMIVGGVGVGTDLLSFDIASGEWTAFPGDLRVPGDHIRAVVFQNEIWWMGGRLGEGPGGSTSNRVLIWNPVSRVWREGPPMLFARSGFAAGVVRGQIVVTAGERIDIMPAQLIPTTEVFSPGAAGWVTGPAPPIAVHGTTGAVAGNRLILVAGSDVAASLSTNRATQILEFDAD